MEPSAGVCSHPAPLVHASWESPISSSATLAYQMVPNLPDCAAMPLVSRR